MSIPTRTLGSRLEVGAVGFGAMSDAMPDGQSATGITDTPTDLISRALDLGATLIDTSDGYGDSEEIISRAITGRRNTVTLATKFGIVSPPRGCSPKIRTCCQSPER